MATPARLAKINGFKRLGFGTYGGGIPPPFINFKFEEVAAVVGNKQTNKLFGPDSMTVYGCTPEAAPIRDALHAMFLNEVHAFAAGAAAKEEAQRQPRLPEIQDPEETI